LSLFAQKCKANISNKLEWIYLSKNIVVSLWNGVG